MTGRGLRDTILIGPLYTDREICSFMFSLVNGLSIMCGNEDDGSRLRINGGSPGFVSWGGSIISSLSY